MKILSIVGARPQFIKAAPLNRALIQAGISDVILHTGQHYDPFMSQVFFDEMKIPAPQITLQLKNSTHASMTAEMLIGIEREILNLKPDYVLVYGDTNSTLAGALAASKLNIPVIHIEAGERSFNRTMPEEVNRVLTDHMSSLLFCCSNRALDRIREESIQMPAYNVGDLLYDAFRLFSEDVPWPTKIQFPDHPFILSTIHRASNTDQIENLSAIFEGLSKLEFDVLLPIHPRTQAALSRNRITPHKNIHLLPPVSYKEMLALLRECSFVATDSGGLQKEAYYAGKKSLILRDETEWTELVDIDAAKLVGTNVTSIVDASKWANTPPLKGSELYGDGNASKKIVQYIQHSSKS